MPEFARNGCVPDLGRQASLFSRGCQARALRRNVIVREARETSKQLYGQSILVAFVYAAVMVIPVLINEYEFQDSLQNIARFASVNRKNNEQVKQAVLEEAQKEDLPIQAADIKVEGSAGNVHINVDYSVTVDLKFYQWTLNFHPDATNLSLF